MKICAAQTRPVIGDIQSNIDNHKALIDLAVSHGANAIVFPELSLTGYEPKLSRALASHQDDGRLDGLQKISDAGQITIGVGIPTKYKNGICISMIIFQPHKARQTYSKKFLHADEEGFFISGPNPDIIKVKKKKLAMAICYEISIPEHSENAFKNGAEIYIASVAKFRSGLDKALDNLAGIAKNYSMTVLMSNCIGTCDGEECAGNTSIWNNEGVLLGQLDDKNEGILMIDTDTLEITNVTRQKNS